MSEFDTAILPDDSFDILVKFDVIRIDYRTFRLPPLGTNIGLVALGSIRAWTLAPLGFDIIILCWLGLRIINIPNSQPDSTHPYDSIFFKLETFRFIRLFGVFANYVPKLFFRIRVNSLQVDHILVEYPITLGYSVFSLALLICNPDQLLCLLLFLVQVSSFTIWLGYHVGVLGSKGQDNLFLLLSLSQPA